MDNKPDLLSMLKDPPPRVAGRLLTVEEWRAWVGWAESGLVQRAALEAGVPQSTVLAWVGEDWWIALTGYWRATQQAELVHGLMAQQDNALSALKAVLAGEAKYAKSANAVVRAVELLTKVAEPAARAQPRLSKVIPDKAGAIDGELVPQHQQTQAMLTAAALEQEEEEDSRPVN